MSPTTVVERLTRVFHEVFKDPYLALSPATATKDIKGWDSFTFLNLVVAVEEEFGVTCSTWELGAFTSVGEIADLLAQKGAPAAP